MAFGLRILGVVGTLGLVSACDITPRTPTSPPPAAPGPQSPLPTARLTVSGTIWVHGVIGVTPLANGVYFGWVKTEGMGMSTGPLITDAAGRYSYEVPENAGFRFQLGVNHGYQPCAFRFDVTSDITRDIRVISDINQLGAALPAELRAERPLLSGVAYEMVDGVRRPVAGAYMQMEAADELEFVAAWTLTDGEGRFMFCGLEGETSAYIYGRKEGFRSSESRLVPINGDTIADIELRR